MTQNEPPIDLIVLGGGIAGLTVALRARQAGYGVKLLEKTDRVGGPIRSERVEGFLLEHGPNTVQPQGEIISLVQHLDLENKLLFADPRLPRFVRFGGELHRAPATPPALFKSGLLSVGGRLRLLLEPFMPRLHADTDETLLSFARRRLGNEAAERLVAPFVSGIWAGDADQLSAVSAFPSLHRWESRHGSLMRGAMAERKKHTSNGTTAAGNGLMSFYDGMETLPRAMAQVLGADLQTGAPAERIWPEQPWPGEIIWHVKAGGHEFRARNLVLAVPSYEAAGLVAPFAPAAGVALDAIPYVPVAVVHMGFRTEHVGRRPDGFGFLSTPSEPSDILGCLWSSSLFGGRAPEGQHLFTVIMGGARRRELPDLPDNELVARALADLRETMRLTGRPSFLRVVRHRRAIPQYTLGHGRRMLTLAKTEKLFPGLRFSGNYLAGIAVGDVVRQATTLVTSDI